MLYFTNDLSKVVILFSGFRVTSFHTFILATLFVISLCWCERLFNYYYENARYKKDQKRFKTLVIRTFGYAVLTILRFFYMLLIMSMSSQIFIVVVTGLTTGQLIVEYIRSIPVYSTHQQLVPTSKDDPTLANTGFVKKLDDYRDELEFQSQSFIIENVNSDDEYDHQIYNDIINSEHQSLVNK
ncbi:copper transporter [Rhizophagus clarus]|uniref:Copper transport protein n=1 Tax=Rhizophagus clarus TaxID=94130 RepID=A0A8H3MAW3_9GLOM|nr:copper transporter [Rhizophagus clarus]